MSKPRHLPLTLLLLLTLLFATGCWRESPQVDRFAPGEPLYERLTSRGSRTLIQSPTGPVLKIRFRAHSTKVYDQDMRPVGKIVATDDGHFQARPLTGPARTTHRIDDDVVELPQGWRLERTADGFDIFSPQGILLGLLRHRDDGQWILRPGYRAQEYLIAEQRDDALHLIDHLQQTILSAPTRQTPLMLLATSLTELPPLDRFTLALWLDHNLSHTTAAAPISD